MKLPISVIILTYNEEQNIENCLKSVIDWAQEIFIVDSYSTDKTLEIAQKYGAKVAQHPFETQAQQFNWALENLNIKTEWVLRLDADEAVLLELWEELSLKLAKALDDVGGFYIKRRVYFMNKWIRHGGYYPTWLLRLFRYGWAKSEERKMDEHIILIKGRAGKLKNDFIDNNKKDLTWWIGKHNNYALREASEILEGQKVIKGISGQVKMRRIVKEKFYLKMPLFFRAFVYFIYRYFIRLGFLDGKEGLIFHFLQGFWYRFLVDAKIYEAKRK